MEFDMNVILYTKDACSYCTNAKLLLNSKGISYTEYKIGEDFTRETLLEMFPEARTFPIIVVDGFNIGGYVQLKEKLESTSTENRKFLIEG
jgi:glutaredoxin 3